MFVGSIFWLLYAIDREVVYPAKLDEFIPSWLNHSTHTLILILVVLEMKITFREYPKRSTGLKRAVGFMAIYLSAVHVIRYKFGIWAYPLLEILSFPMKLAFYGFLLVCMILFYVVGEKLNGVFWRNEIHLIGEKNKTKKSR